MTRERGWKAVGAGAVLVVFAGWLSFQFVVSGRSLERAGVAALRDWLEYEPHAAEPAQAVDVLTGRWTDRPVSAEAPRKARVPFEIVSVQRHGWDRDFVVRVELRYPEGAPDGTPRLRYFRMRYTPARNAWRILGETTALSYYLALLP